MQQQQLALRSRHHQPLGTSTACSRRRRRRRRRLVQDGKQEAKRQRKAGGRPSAVKLAGIVDLTMLIITMLIITSTHVAPSDV